MNIEVLQKQDIIAARIYDNDDNLFHTGRESKVAQWSKTVDDISELGLEGDVEETPAGLLLVKGRYYFSPTSNKWRAKGKSKWYWSKGFKDFYGRFVR